MLPTIPVDQQQRGNMSASQPNSRAGSARPTPNLPHKQNTFNGQSPQGSRSQSRQNSFSSQNQGSRVHSRQNSNAGSQQASQSTSQGNKSSQQSGNSRQSNMYRVSSSCCHLIVYHFYLTVVLRLLHICENAGRIAVQLLQFLKFFYM